jgi:hypothetical protein
LVIARFDPESPLEAQALSPLNAITTNNTIVDALFMLPPPSARPELDLNQILPDPKRSRRLSFATPVG